MALTLPDREIYKEVEEFGEGTVVEIYREVTRIEKKMKTPNTPNEPKPNQTETTEPTTSNANKKTAAPAQSSSTPASAATRTFSKFEITEKALVINETKDANPNVTYSDFRVKDQSTVINAALPEDILGNLIMAQMNRN